MKRLALLLFFGMAGVVIVYTNDYEAHEAINRAAQTVGYLLLLVLVLGVTYVVLWYLLPAYNDHRDRVLDRQLKQQFISADSNGLFPLHASYYRHLETQQALLMASVQKQIENPQTLVNPRVVQTPAQELLSPSLPDRVLFADYQHRITDGCFALGVQSDGNLLEVQLKDVWHLLNNAQSGSGKTNNIDSFITQVHYLPHSEMGLYLVDYKGELKSVWGRSPMVRAIGSGANVEDIQDIIVSLSEEVHRRNILFERTQERYPRKIIRGYASYRLVTGQALSMVYVVVDELNALMASTKTNARLQIALGNVLQMGRSAGINVLSGAQHMTADVLPKQYYINFATRIQMGQYDPNTTSRLLGGKPTQEHIRLVNGRPGRALVKVNGQQEPIPVQMLMVQDDDILDAIAYSIDHHGYDGGELIGNEFTAYEPSEPEFKIISESANNEPILNSSSSNSDAVHGDSDSSGLSYDAKVWAVKYLRGLSKGKNTILWEIWRVKPGGTEGYKQASTEYDKIIALLEGTDL